MGKLSNKEKLAIANSGGSFAEVGQSSWVGTKIRKGKKEGVVVSDMNGRCRELTVRFDGGEVEEIRMNNIGPDSEYIHDYKFFSSDRWIRF